MILSHTVLTPCFNWVRHMFNSETDEHAVSSISSLSSVTDSLESDEMILENILPEVVNVKTPDTIDLQFRSKDYKQMHDCLKNLFKIRKYILKSTHEDQSMLLTVNKKIDNIEEKLENAKKNTYTDIVHNHLYREKIAKEFINIGNAHSVSGAHIVFINDACNKAGIKFSIKGQHLSSGQMRKVLIQVDTVMYKKIVDQYKIFDNISELLEYIYKKKQRMRYDTRDKQPMRKVIGISIAVCAIVTLYIILLIALHNKNRANPKVELFDWV